MSSDPKGLDRRELIRLGLAATAVAALSPFEVLAFGRSSRLVFALLDHGEDSDPRPTALRRLAWEVSKRTSIECELETVRLAATAPELFYHPLVVLAGSRGFPDLDEASIIALRRYLTYGGLLLIDSTAGGDGSPFDQSVRRLLDRALPGRKLAQIPRQQVLFKSFYLLDGPGGRDIRRPYLNGIELDGRWAVVYSQNDLLGAWARDDLGMWEYEVESRQRENTFRFGVNLVMYAMCLDYKDDQVHLPFILKRRKS